MLSPYGYLDLSFDATTPDTARIIPSGEESSQFAQVLAGEGNQRPGLCYSLSTGGILRVGTEKDIVGKKSGHAHFSFA
jgi:hypothetical protein